MLQVQAPGSQFHVFALEPVSALWESEGRKSVSLDSGASVYSAVSQG